MSGFALSIAATLNAHLLVFLTLVSLSIYTIRRNRCRGAAQLPPGPKGIPLLGNLFQLSMKPWKEFEVWKKEFGPLVYINMAGQGILVLNTHETTTDLLDRRGNIYSDRPRLVVVGEVLGGGLMLPFLKTGGLFHTMRRAGQDALNKARITEFYPVQMREAVRLANDMMQNPSDWENQLFLSSASTVLSVLYDLPEAKSVTDPLVEGINRFVVAINEGAIPGSHLVEVFTWMKYIPSFLAPWKRRAETAHREHSAMFSEMFNEVKKRIDDGDERPSFSGTLIREPERHQLSDLEATWLTATLYTAGAETAASTMKWFMLAMIAYPEKQRRCQEELDAVVGRARMPTFKDRDSLPYLQATVREVLRWQTVAPIGVPHYTKEDDWYQGYHIPKGTICFANAWSLNHDPSVYGNDTNDFNPDRFIDDNGQFSSAVAGTKDEGHVSYGFGPRICPGRHMANNALFINIASVLWAMSISPVMDEVGRPVIPDASVTVDNEAVVRPVPFEISVTPRFPEATAILAHMRETF